MDIDQLPEDLLALCQRAQQAREDCAQVRQDLQATRAETRDLLEQLQHIHPDDAWSQPTPADDPAAPPLFDPLVPSAAPLDREKLALHMLRAVLNDFPLEMQATLLKALTVRTIVLMHDELRQPMALSA